MFAIQETPIDIAQLKSTRCDPADGAFVNFEGIVRADELKQGRVCALVYIAENAGCLNEGEKILEQARQQFAITEAVCVQRTGHLNVGETAIWIGVWAGHRDEAFKACRFIIEEVKKRLLIWKKEVFSNGQTKWVYGPQTPVI